MKDIATKVRPALHAVGSVEVISSLFQKEYQEKYAVPYDPRSLETFMREASILVNPRNKEMNWPPVTPEEVRFAVECHARRNSAPFHSGLTKI